MSARTLDDIVADLLTVFFVWDEDAETARAVNDANPRIAELFREFAANETAKLRAALERIESLEARADGSVGFVDSPHVKAMRAMAKIAREAIAPDTEASK